VLLLLILSKEAVYACWGTLYGLALLYMSGHMFEEKEHVEKLAVQSVMTIIHK